MNIVEAIRRANLPGPPENSIRLRVACTGAVLIGIAAAAGQGEMSRTDELAFGALVVAGMVFSYRTRRRPPGWIKVVLAVGAVAVMVWFVRQIGSGQLTDITNVEDPLTVLFAAIQAIHSFHVPSRRDLVFSVGGSAGLMAIAAAQAIDMQFAVYGVAWVVCGWWALLEMWRSASGGGRVRLPGLGGVLVVVIALSAVVFVALPAPVVAIKVGFITSAGTGGAVGVPGALAGDSGGSSELSRPGTPGGATRIGGYLGFASTLDTALRGSLSHTIVLRVRAQFPSYWVGETFDRWDGQSWATTTSKQRQLQFGSPFNVPTPAGETGLGQADLQTFYVATSTADLIFHAETASQVWFPASSIYYSSDDTLVSPIGLDRGAVYTVESNVNEATRAQLRVPTVGSGLSPSQRRLYTQLPQPYTQVRILAKLITLGDTTTYDKIESLISWIGANTHYSTDIPPLPRGADTVDEFLFGNRVGFCEQISTALAVMLRTLGIPAREAVGYVPGGYNPVTDLYEVRADDAHAWVQVYFPLYGWQSFDPTAVVPLANPDPGSTAVKDVAAALGRLPWPPIGSAVAVVALVAAGWEIRRRRPATWAEQAARRIERAGRRAGRRRGLGETLGEYAAVVDAARDPSSDRWRRLADAAEASAYGGRHPPPEVQRALLTGTYRPVDAVRQ